MKARCIRSRIMAWILRGAVPCALLPVACASGGSTEVVPARPVILPLDPATMATEFSGLCWWGDDLLILPQFPTGAEGQGVLVLERDSLARAIAEIEAGRPVRPLRPRSLRAEAVGIVESIPRYDGLEAIAIRGDRCYALAEYGTDAQGGWGSRLLAGTVSRADGSVRFERLGSQHLEGRQMRTNFTHESLILAGEEVWVLSELNGPRIVDGPRVLRFDDALRPLGDLALPSIDYRITDATDLEADGRFWVLDIFWPADRETVLPMEGDRPVERLVPLRFDGTAVVRDADRPVLDLRADPGGEMHNWEGVARWGDEGFLLVTDSYPADLLAYVARPSG